MLEVLDGLKAADIDDHVRYVTRTVEQALMGSERRS